MANSKNICYHWRFTGRMQGNDITCQKHVNREYRTLEKTILARRRRENFGPPGGWGGGLENLLAELLSRKFYWQNPYDIPLHLCPAPSSGELSKQS